MNNAYKQSLKFYKSIKASDNLYKKIVDNSNNYTYNNKKIFLKFGFSFACIAIITSILLIFTFKSKTDITIFGEDVGDKPIVLSNISTANYALNDEQKNNEILIVPIDINSNKKVYIKASVGTLLPDENNKNKKAIQISSDEFEISNKYRLYWKLNIDNISESKLSITSDSASDIYKIKKDTNDQLLFVKSD